MKTLTLLLLVLLSIACSSEKATETNTDGDVENTETPEPCLEETMDCEGPYARLCKNGVWEKTLCLETEYCNYGMCENHTVNLPADAGYHDLQSEWWYYTGHVHHGDKKWGFQVTIFQYDIEAAFNLKGYGYMCHMSITDKVAGEHYHQDTITLEPTEWSNDPFILEVKDCRIELGGDGYDHIIASIPEGKEKDGKASPWKLDLTLTPTKRIVFNGENGIVDMGDDAQTTSWYYSYARMTATGTLLTPEGEFDVTGQTWMDHQWGDFDNTEFKGWDWWSMQFSDGYEIMLYTITDWDDNRATQSGTIIDPQGNQTDLSGEDVFTITPLRDWESPHTDGVYPLDWDIEIKKMDWKIKVTTSVDDQEMHNLSQTYWEGETTITGSRNGEPVSGVGYTELTGYATDIQDQQRERSK